MFIVPYGAPAGYEWFVALVVLVGLYFAVRNFMRARRSVCMVQTETGTALRSSPAREQQFCGGPFLLG
jgi:hypothetical protein